jgi:hypothetical protein
MCISIHLFAFNNALLQICKIYRLDVVYKDL